MGDQQERNHHQHPKHRGLYRPGRKQPLQHQHLARHRKRTAHQHIKRPLQHHQHRIRRCAQHQLHHQRTGRHQRICRRHRLRETGKRPQAQQYGIHHQQEPRIHLAEDHPADRPGIGRGLRIHLHGTDLSGGRIFYRPDRQQELPLRQDAEKRSQHAEHAELGLDDEERLFTGRHFGGTGQLPARHQIPERHDGRLPQLPARREVQEPAAHPPFGLGPLGQQEQPEPERILRLRGGLHH